MCVLFTVAHHHNHESLARRAAIIGLVKTFTIDLLDTVDILDVLFDTAKENPVSRHIIYSMSVGKYTIYYMSFG